MQRIVFVVLCLSLVAACTPSSPAAQVTPLAVVIASNRIINFWQTVGDTLAAPNSRHPWQFVGRQGDGIRAAAAGAVITLQTSTGDVLSEGAQIEATLPVDDTYTLLIQPDSTERGGPYRLTLEYTDRPDPSKPTATPTLTPTPTVTPTPTPVYATLGTPIARVDVPGPLAGSFAAPDEQHVYLFDGLAGEYVSIGMNRVSGQVDPALTLHDPAGTALAFDDDSGTAGGALLRNIILPADGLYSVQARGDGAGTYLFEVRRSTLPEPVQPVIPQPTATPTTAPSPTPPNDRLLDHVPVTGSIARSGDFARYPIQAAAGDILTVGVSPVAGLTMRPEIELYSPIGELVETATVYTSNAGGDALIAAYRALETGVYVALVTSEGDTTGTFVISYGLGASREDVRRGDAPPDQTMPGEVARRGLRDIWTLSLRAGDIIAAAVSAQSATFDPSLDLISPEGTVLSSSDNSSGGRNPVLDSITIPADGIYSLRVTGANAASSGTYTLVWRYIVAAPTITPPPASLLLLSASDLAPQQTYLYYPFQGRRGQRILVRVLADAGSSFDGVAALLGPDGTTIIESDDGEGMNPRIETLLLVDGTYTVRVTGYGQSTGAFSITVEALF